MLLQPAETELQFAGSPRATPTRHRDLGLLVLAQREERPSQGIEAVDPLDPVADDHEEPELAQQARSISVATVAGATARSERSMIGTWRTG